MFGKSQLSISFRCSRPHVQLKRLLATEHGGIEKRGQKRAPFRPHSVLRCAAKVPLLQTKIEQIGVIFSLLRLRSLKTSGDADDATRVASDMTPDRAGRGEHNVPVFAAFWSSAVDKVYATNVNKAYPVKKDALASRHPSVHPSVCPHVRMTGPLGRGSHADKEMGT